ncbi:hypothetical protein BCR35DRAFT_350764 [Leucosporidium creatinivorum]|uniref:Uncharacterized protein n=1 Tax=Leucosporidium creatinivorum TaxID=106004 RepID=A0A1Y2FXX8_9BASI|nr:hypothetical protein BCR35DRAFT_350764 [Leucosporidium creatinivorum]
MPGLAKEHARRASADLSAWWTNKQQQPQSQPMLARHQSAPQNTPYDVYHPSTKAAPPSNRRRSSETVTASSPTSTPVDPSRAHLHYRDQQQQQFVTAQDEGYGDSEKKNLQEEDELARALEASQRETEAKMAKTAKEDEELRAALAESTRLARLNPSLAAQEQADLSKALLASQREVLQGSALSRPPRSSAREQSTGMVRSSSTSLEESEWALRARNEKGSLWNEAGAHGWLPPGASRAGGEDEREMEMLELAIRISLEEEEERKAREAELQAEIDYTARPSLHGQMSDSTHHSSYATAPSVPSDDSAHFSEFQRSSTPQTLANSPPKRKLPPPPASHIVTQPLSPPTSPHVGSVEHERDSSAPPLPPNPYYSPTTAHSSQAPPLPSRAPPSPPASELERSPNPSSASQLQPPQAPWTADPERSSSPYEIPFLTSSPSIRRSGAPWQPPSPLVDDESGRFSGASYTSTPSTGSMLSRNSPNFGSDQEDDNRIEEDPLEALTVRNPDASQPPSRDPPPPPPTTTALPAFESTMTGRSLSLVSEATEPPSPSSAGADSVPSQLFGAERGAASPPVQSPTLMQALQNEPPQFVSPPAEQEIAEDRWNEVTTHAAAATELPPPEPEQTTFGEGVRFGYPRACAHEEDHTCSLDGLGSDGPFPSEVVLSSESEGEERSAFSIEARSWAGLLRFLMWYGETTVAASSSDIAASPHRHCDASLSLSFRHDDLGSSILRLTISLLPVHEHSHSPDPELTIASPPPALNHSTGKGKGKARAPTSTPSTTFLLPDHLVLPTRLSSTAHTLYSLRHLAQIALSTQPSKHASPSYHALRALAQSIQQLALVSSKASAGEGKSGLGAGGRGQDDLVGRLRERLKRMRGAKDARGE